MSRIHDLAELILRPKDGRKCCVCYGTGVSGVVRSGNTTTPMRCPYCAGRGTNTGPYSASERLWIVEPAGLELAELVLKESN